MVPGQRTFQPKNKQTQEKQQLSFHDGAIPKSTSLDVLVLSRRLWIAKPVVSHWASLSLLGQKYILHILQNFYPSWAQGCKPTILPKHEYLANINSSSLAFAVKTSTLGCPAQIALCFFTEPNSIVQCHSSHFVPLIKCQWNWKQLTQLAKLKQTYAT